MKNYDLVVVGSGVGLTVLNQALNRGMECALVERDKLGGTCLTRGCIPSKVLVYPADVIREAAHARSVGLDLEVRQLHWDRIAERMWSQIEESEAIEAGLETVDTLTLYRGRGVFVDDHTMVVHTADGKHSKPFTAERFVLASGARSMLPPIDGLEETDFVTSERFFGEKFPQQPWDRLIIIGGGVIAAEFAHIFSAFGTKVTMVEMLPRLVTTEEPEVSAHLLQNFRNHMTVHLNTRAVAMEEKDENDETVVTVEDTESGKHRKLVGDAVLVATGRRSNADLLEVERTGVETDENGWIVTNEFLETSASGIWCIGDANGKYQFRHKANYDAEICVRNMFGDRRTPVDYSTVPWAIFTWPQIGHVGMTTEEAIEKGHKILVAKKHYSSVAKGFAMGLQEGDTDDGFVKLVVDDSYHILGAHVIGPSAAALVQQFVYLMNAGYTCTPDPYGDGPRAASTTPLPKSEMACPSAGSFLPIYDSMVIHPSINEVAAWAIGALQPVNFSPHSHSHSHSHSQAQHHDDDE